MRDTTAPAEDVDDDVVIGDDWVAPDENVEKEMRERRARRGFLSLRSSPLTRRIITFNLIALNILAAGILYLTSSREGLVMQRAQTLATDAALIADVFEARLPATAPANFATNDGIDAAEAVAALTLRSGLEVFVYDTQGLLVARFTGQGLPAGVVGAVTPEGRRTFITDGLLWVWDSIARLMNPPQATAKQPLDVTLADFVPATLEAGIMIEPELDGPGGKTIAATSVIRQTTRDIGVVAVTSPAGEIDALVRAERERVLQMFLIATLVSIGLSMVLASTIANPLSDLAAAAEVGRDRNARRTNPGRVRIPDLTARPDEIGRLSAALRGLVSALYTRIESNEQFAADVAHEIKNPLASLRSAVGTLRMIKREDQREKLLDVIDHDVRRLDRLVSDISNASRLDSELVKEEEEEFNLLTMLENLGQYLGEDARAKGVEFISDMPSEPIMVHGLEARLAQVFVNLITNAISFCEDGDAIRVWARKRQSRVLVVVEDTGPGIPEQALTKVFQRFYSQRPEEHFGQNSGLGLAISKQIIEAHGGVIWAENIRPTEADVTSDPLGARFVVGLPL